jgi:hypothetical protein
MAKDNEDQLIDQILSKYSNYITTTTSTGDKDWTYSDSTGATPWEDLNDYMKNIQQPYNQPYTTIGVSNEELINAINALAEKVDLIFNMLRLIMTTQLEEELKQKAKEAKEAREKDQE